MGICIFFVRMRRFLLILYRNNMFAYFIEISAMKYCFTLVKIKLTTLIITSRPLF